MKFSTNTRGKKSVESCLFFFLVREENKRDTLNLSESMRERKKNSYSVVRWEGLSEKKGPPI